MRTSLKQYIDSLLTQNYKLRNMHIPFHKEEMNKYHGKDSGKYDYALQWFNRQEKELEANKMIIKEYGLLTAKAKAFDEIEQVIYENTGLGEGDEDLVNYENLLDEIEIITNDVGMEPSDYLDYGEYIDYESEAE